MARTQTNTNTSSNTNTMEAFKAKLAKARAENRELRAENSVLGTRIDEVAALLADREQADAHYQTEAQRRLSSALDEVIGEFTAPSWYRRLSGAVLALALSYGAGWLIGAVLNYVIVGAAVATGSLALVLFIYVIGMICSALAGLVIGLEGYSFVVSGRIDQTYDTVKNKVTGWFSSKPSLAGFFTKSEAA